MTDIQPVPARRDQHEDIAELMMRVISVVQLPAHPIVPRKGTFTENSLDIVQNASVNKHPKVVEMADRDDVKAKPDLAGYQVVAEQRVA